jgi:molybdopterin molybdotransferase
LGRIAYETPGAALDALIERVVAVGEERVPLADAGGRALAQDVRSDRPSPACDVSAMDGYAVRIADLAAGRLPIGGHARIGTAPIELPAGAAAHIVTGAPLPLGAEAVVKREDVVEGDGWIDAPWDVRPGTNVRRAGESCAAGTVVAEAGTVVTPPLLGALSAFGVTDPTVRARVRVAVLVTGDEVLGPESAPAPWQLRDSNGAQLRGFLERRPWVEVGVCERVPDDREALVAALGGAVAAHDAVVLTGGVSMGDRDYVPEAVAACGGRVVFHRLPQRPGRPALGAVTEDGAPVFGLPGNPVSVMVTARRLALPALRKRAGVAMAGRERRVRVAGVPTGQRLWWYRLARLVEGGDAELVPNVGSGDVAALARSEGFVEVAPGARDSDRLAFYGWDD